MGLVAKMNDLCGSHSVHLFMTILSGISSFIILFIGDTSMLDKSTELRHVLHSGQYWHGSSLVSLALIVPLLTDTMLNLIIRILSTKSYQQNSEDIHSTVESLLFHCGMILPVIMPFLPESARYPAIVHCCTRAQLFIVLGVIFAYKVRVDPKFCPRWLTMVYYALSITCNALYPYVYQTPTPLDSIIHLSGNIAIAATVTQYGALAILVFALVQSILLQSWDKCGCTRGDTVKPTAAATEADSGINSRQGLYMWCTVIVLGWLCVRVVLYEQLQSSFLNYGDNELFLFNIPNIAFQFFFLLLSIRVVRQDAVSSLYGLIEAKKQYVRYISHELRTPLSAATSGLQVLEQEITAALASLHPYPHPHPQSSVGGISGWQAAAEAAEEGIRDTLADVSLAVTTSVSAT